MKSVYIETYGCSANQAHSETMESSLVSNGFRITERPGKADVIVINTCVVKSPTENRIRERIRFLVSRYPKKRLVIAGCASDVGLFRDIATHAIFLSSHKSGDLVKLLTGKSNKTGRKIRRNPVVNITEIASGCLGRCSYCIVRLARGDMKSRSIGGITREIEDSLKDGCREIWLTSQDCGCYGLDKGTNLASLVRNVSKLDWDFRIRVGMMNPTHVKPILKDLIEVYRNPKVYRFIHVPVQSGSDRILRAMRRGYSVKDFERIVNAFRRQFPDLTVSTDVIVGFPGETDKDFRQTLDLIRRVKPDIVNVSKFGSRPGTEASRLKQLDNKVVKQRSKEFASVLKEIGIERKNDLLGKECVILVTERGKRRNQFSGRDETYKPVIVESKNNLIGEFLKVRIAYSGLTYLKAEITRNSV